MTTKVNLATQVEGTSDDLTEGVVNLFLSSSDQTKLDNLPSNTNSALSGKQGNITLTTTGSFGPATLIADTLNIPQYVGGLTGDMTKAVYDPTNINSSAFSQDNMLDGTTNKNYTAIEKTKLAGIAIGANVGVVPNTAITGATKTKITYDAKGLVVSGADATTADIADSTDRRYLSDIQKTEATRNASTSQNGLLSSTDWNTFNSKAPALGANDNYVTDAEKIVIGNTSGTNSGDQSETTLGIDAAFKIGSPTSLINTNDRMNHQWSAGCTEGGAITNNGDGTINIAQSTTLIRQSLTVTSITRVGSTATVTTSSTHGYNTAEVVFMNGANQTEYNGNFNITVTGANTFTYQVDGTPATPATGTIYTCNEHSQLIVAVVPAVTNMAMVDHTTNYIYAAYNAGTPIYLTTTDGTIVSGLSRTNLWIIGREGTTLDFVDTRATNVDTANKVDMQLHEVETFSHVEGGTRLSEVGTRNFKVTAGAFYHGLNKITHKEFDTSISDTFTTAYQTSGVWTFTTGQTQISNTQYNNTTTGLASLTVGNYGVYWVYMINNDPSRLMVVYGTGDYSTKALAYSSQTPTIPLSLNGIGEIIGKIIIQQGASTFTDIISRYITRFPIDEIHLNSLADVNTPDAPNLGDNLQWNGVSWVNAQPSTASAATGQTFYDVTPVINPTGTGNSLELGTISQTPIVTAEQTVVGAASVGGVTFAIAAKVYDQVLGRTTIPAGLWEFNTFASISSLSGTTTLTRQIYKVTPALTGTITATGTGTTRTITASAGTPFSLANIDASATNTTASYLQTPSGIYQISARTSDTVVTIITPTGYVNDSAVTFSVFKKLFASATSSDFASLTVSKLSILPTVQAAFTIAATDKFGTITFQSSTANNIVVTIYYNGNVNNTNIIAPFVILHNDIPGLQGGQSGQYYHMTSAQSTILSNTSGTNSGNETVNSIGSLINGSTAAIPNDTDLIAIADTSVLKKITWANIKATLKTYFDSLTTTLTNKTINLTSNTLTGTKTQFNTACSDGDMLYVGDSVNVMSMTTGSILGRNTAGSGNVEYLNATTVKTMIALENVDNTSDATKNSATATLTNKSLSDSTTHFVDVTDPTKRLNIDVAGTTGITGILQSIFTTAKTLILPDANDTLVGKATTDTFTNKTINLTSNTLTGTITEFNTACSDADFATGGGTATGTNTGNQTITNTSDATSHTATLSASGGSIKLVEGTNITLTTTGTGADGVVTIASTGGTGDVVGPVSATDNAIARFDTTTGKLLQNSGPTITDDGEIVIPYTGASPLFSLGGGLSFSYSTLMKILDTTRVNELLSFLGVGFAVNEFTISNAATTTGPILEATGGDINIDININPKGTGRIKSGTVTIPTISSTDTFTNKTINATDNTITDTSTAVGDLLKSNGTKFVKFTKGTANQQIRVNAGGTDLEYFTPTASGATFWQDVPGTPTRTGNTTFTITGDYTSIFTKGVIIKWTESSAIKCGMISIPSTYGAPNTTITIIGDTMTSIDTSSCKYCFESVDENKFAVAGSIGATGTNVANAYYAKRPERVIGADLQVGTAGTTNNTTIDLNKGGTTMFTTKPTLATTVASSPTPFTADNSTSLALGDKVTIDIDAFQTTAAVDLYATLYTFPTYKLNLT